MNICMYVCMCVVCMYVHMYVCMHVCTYVCMYVCMYMCVCMYVCIYVCMYVHVCTVYSMSSHPVSAACEFLPALHNSGLCCTPINKHGMTEHYRED